ncbi:hypothetical protein HK096_010370 [Nowakowskiella sp. JEL0078]|nr:hypothetical protein HK096_010370 [Nowakowskiella sp. JEL0078]
MSEKEPYSLSLEVPTISRNPSNASTCSTASDLSVNVTKPDFTIPTNSTHRFSSKAPLTTNNQNMEIDNLSRGINATKAANDETPPPYTTSNRTWTSNTSIIVVERTKTDPEPIDDTIPDVTWSSVYKGVWSLTSTSTTAAASVAKSAARAAVAAAADSQTLNNAYKAASEAAARSQTLTSAIKVAKEAANTAANSPTLNTAYKAAKEAANNAANSQTLNTAYKSVKSLVVPVPGHARRSSATLSGPYFQSESRRASLAPSWSTAGIVYSSDKAIEEKNNDLLQGKKMYDEPSEEKTDLEEKPVANGKTVVEEMSANGNKQSVILQSEDPATESILKKSETSELTEDKPLQAINTLSTNSTTLETKTRETKLISDEEVLKETLNSEFKHEFDASTELSASKNTTVRFEIDQKDTLKRHRVIEKMDKMIDEVEIDNNNHDDENLVTSQPEKDTQPNTPQIEPVKKPETLSKRKSRISTRAIFNEKGELYVEDVIVRDQLIAHWEPFPETENIAEGLIKIPGYSESDVNIDDPPEDTVEPDSEKKPAMRRMVSQVRRVLRIRKKQSKSQNLTSVDETTPTTPSSATLTTPTTSKSVKLSLEEKRANRHSMDSPGLNLLHFTFARSGNHNRTSSIVDTSISGESPIPDSSNGDNGSVVSSDDSNGVEIQIEVMTRPLTPFDAEVSADEHLLGEDHVNEDVDDTLLAHSLVKVDDNDVISLYSLDDRQNKPVSRPTLRIAHRGSAYLSPHAVYDEYEEMAERTRTRATSGSLPKPFWDIGTPMKHVSSENIEVKIEKHGHKKGFKGFF